jgi:trimethylamine--corrinoid protein Co-methyltransferase
MGRRDRRQKFVLDELRYAYGRSNVLSRDDLDKIHGATMEVLATVGIKMESPRARSYFEKAGATVEGEIVKIPEYVVLDAIKTAPRSIFLAGRDEKNDYSVRPGSIAFVNFGEGIDVIDPYTKEHRRSTTKDLEKITRVADAIDVLPVGFRAVAAADKPPHMQALYNAQVMFNNTSKHWFMGPDGGENAELIIDMAAKIVGDRKKLRERPILTFNVCPTSPLQLNPTTTDGIIAGAENGIPVNIISMALSGATAPVTIAGTLVTHNAEVLAALTLDQLAGKGAPVIYGSSTTMMDMVHLTTPVGSPELAMINNSVAQLARYYLLPSFVAGG